MNKLFKLILIFFFIFDISFINFPVSTGKISALIFALLYISKNKIKIIKSISGFQLTIILFLTTLLIYNFSLDIIFETSDGTVLLRIIYFIIYTLIMSIVIPDSFSNIIELLKTVGYATSVQGCFVFVSWLSSSFRYTLSRLVINTGNISFLSARRPPGFMSSAGAGSSMILAIGATLIFWIIISGYSKYKVFNLLAFAISFAATFIVGRTGFILCVALISIIILEKSIKQPSKLKTLFIVLPVIILLMLGATNLFLTYLPEQVSMKFDWFFGEFGEGLFSGNTVTALKSMTIKPISWETIIGTAQIRPFGGNHDSGYIQNYHSMGLIVSILFYSFVVLFIRYLYRNKLDSDFKSKNKLFILVLCIGMFIVELKEPFIFYYFYPWIVFSLLRENNFERKVD